MRKEYRGRSSNDNAESFPYEPLVMGKRVVRPAELQKVHRWTGSGSPRTCAQLRLSRTTHLYRTGLGADEVHDTDEGLGVWSLATAISCPGSGQNSE